MEENKKNSTSKSGSNTNSYVDLLKKRLAEKTASASSRQTVGEENKLAEPERIGKKTKAKKTKNTEPVPTIPTDWKESIKNDQRSAKKVEQPEQKKEGSVLKMLGIVSLCVVMTVVLVVGGYFAFLQITYSRLADMRAVEIKNNVLSRLAIGEEYSISTFNIGFGAYSQSFSFFMDEGEMNNGTLTKGKSAKAESKEEVKNNISEAISLLKNKSKSDFYFFQEVDTDSTRSHYVNQEEMIIDAFSGYASVFSENAHSKYLFYPLSDPIGKINSGILTLSKYNIDFSIRRSLVIETGMINKLFDLDRCFMVSKLPIYGTNKNLVLINVHLSAYDDGDIRKQQIEALYDLMDYEYNKNGNYVIVGGDFNLCLAGESGIFNNEMKTPGWCQSLPDGYKAENFAEIGYNINYDLSTSIGTCRDASIKYTEGINLEVIIDGFMTSANILVAATSTIDGDFKNSDHNPVKMIFKLI